MKRLAYLLAAVLLFLGLTPFSVYADFSGINTDVLPLSISIEDIENTDEYELTLTSSTSEVQDQDGYVDLPLEPDSAITRAQAVYVLVSGLGAELRAVMPADITVFADFDEIEPEYYQSVALAVALGAIEGSDDGYLYPNEYITRVECFAVVSRILSVYDLPTDLAETDEPFSDVPDWALNDIVRLKNAGLIQGYGDGTLGSDDYISYEQALTVYTRLTELLTARADNGVYRDDYYEYVNEQWLSETVLPDGYAKWSNSEQISQNNAYRVQNIITSIYSEYSAGTPIENGSNEQKILDIYRAASDISYRESVGLEPIQEYLDLIDGIQYTSDLPYVLAELERAGFHSLIPITVNSDFNNSNEYRMTFEGCYTGIESGVVKSDDYEDVKTAYTNYIRTLFIESGQSPTEAGTNAELASSLCIKLAKDTMDESKWDDPAEIYNSYSRSRLRQLFANFNIDEYFEYLGYDTTDDVIVYDNKLASTINSVITRSNIPALKAYLKAAVLDRSALYLNLEMYGAYQTYINEISGVSSTVSPSAYAVSITQSLVGWEIGELYVERYFSSDSKKEIEDLTELIIETFKKRIENLEWMSDETKSVAIEKLDAISVRIGYPDYLIGYENTSFTVRSPEDGGSIMEYIINYNKLKNYQNVTVINESKPVDKEAWSLTPQSVNAYYDRSSNCIVIPAGILQAPYYSPNASFETNLGGIGSVIAHEITHAFDNVGSQFDKDGNLNDWWTDDDLIEFNRICQKFVDEYSEIEVLPGYYVDGELTLSENIADIGAMACILDIAGEDNQNLDQLFKTYARIYRTVCTDEYAKMLLATDEHSPNKVRVNMVLSNFDEFISLYKLIPSDGMYRAESERLSIW